MTTAFRGRYPLRFAHCDPAGIAYYPRYFEIVDAGIEDWTAQTLRVTRAAMHAEHRRGLPTVDLHARFAAVSRFGDLLDIVIMVVAVGRSSVELDAQVSCEGEARFAVRYKQVLMDLDDPKAIAWPQEWRRALEAAQ